MIFFFSLRVGLDTSKMFQGDVQGCSSVYIYDSKDSSCQDVKTTSNFHEVSPRLENLGGSSDRNS